MFYDIKITFSFTIFAYSHILSALPDKVQDVYLSLNFIRTKK